MMFKDSPSSRGLEFRHSLSCMVLGFLVIGSWSSNIPLAVGANIPSFVTSLKQQKFIAENALITPLPSLPLSPFPVRPALS